MLLQILTIAELKEEGFKLKDNVVKEFMEWNKNSFKLDKNINEKDFFYWVLFNFFCLLPAVYSVMLKRETAASFKKYGRSGNGGHGY